MKQTKNQEIILFTKVPNDPAWKKLRKRETFIIFPLAHTTIEKAQEFTLPVKDQIPVNCICVFDDNSSLTRNL